MNVNKILEANKNGLNNEMYSYYTPVLNAAKIIGERGIDLSNCPIVTGKRYGKAPESFLSQNYRDNTSELGLSCYYGDDKIRSEFLERKEYNYKGLLLPFKGSDGESLILCLDAEYLD